MALHFIILHLYYIIFSSDAVYIKGVYAKISVQTVHYKMLGYDRLRNLANLIW